MDNQRDDHDYLMGFINRGEPIPAGNYTLSRAIDLTGRRNLTIKGVGLNIVTRKSAPEGSDD